MLLIHNIVPNAVDTQYSAQCCSWCISDKCFVFTSCFGIVVFSNTENYLAQMQHTLFCATTEQQPTDLISMEDLTQVSHHQLNIQAIAAKSDT